ncbi:hypothetical protein BKA70DRAFT_1241287 [Coprinopsis sp. MPI-PUGE-AT-0042]|nr:hypothetical protein BKA70DRAFT_1241287 [Coprinopsis sp. MPI-PUGE-AT-0042]
MSSPRDAEPGPAIGPSPSPGPPLTPNEVGDLEENLVAIVQRALTLSPVQNALVPPPVQDQPTDVRDAVLEANDDANGVLPPAVVPEGPIRVILPRGPIPMPEEDYRAMVRDGLISYSDVPMPGNIPAGPGTLPYVPWSYGIEQERIRRLHRGRLEDMLDAVEGAVAAINAVANWFSRRT